jgi:hypothetical protein
MTLCTLQEVHFANMGLPVPFHSTKAAAPQNALICSCCIHGWGFLSSQMDSFLGGFSDFMPFFP